MQREHRLARSLVSVQQMAALAVVGALLGHLGACGGGDGVAFPQDGGVGDASHGDPSCPSTPPQVGAACSLPSGAQCSGYAAPGCYCCSSPTYQCQGGTWTESESGGPPGPTPVGCPATLPANGSPCSGGCGAATTCSYTCSSGSGASSEATCESGIWHVLEFAGPCEGLPVDASVFTCGALSCSDGSVCVVYAGSGDAGSSPDAQGSLDAGSASTCVATPSQCAGSTSCDCLTSALPDCPAPTCARDVAGHTTVTCHGG